LQEQLLQRILAGLDTAGRTYAEQYLGASGARQPVHTVYGGAHLFRADTAPRLGELALRALAEYAPEGASLGEILDLDPELAARVHARVSEKLAREPVEDFRLDFEDGYGNRPDAEEDGHAESAAVAVARGLDAGTLPPFLGIRIKPFTPELAGRSIRTLDLFVSALARAAGGRWPAHFVVTLPKVTAPEQCAALAELLDHLEDSLDLAAGAIRAEVMIETTQAILNARGHVAVRGLTEALGARAWGAHFGTYDYTAACDITAAHQHMAHPVCDFAKHVMQVALAGTGIFISDGATNVLPVPLYRAGADGKPLGPVELAANREAVHAGWRLHARHIRHSLTTGYYQGWDLHPAQLVTRYATVYAFFLEGLDAASERLRNFVGKAAQATLVGDVFDDAATGQGLLNYFLRALSCGALSESEAVERSGLSLDELRGRSFAAILTARRARG
jgi:citrate lyase beta subunit